MKVLRPDLFDLNDQAEITIKEIGEENSQLVVIEDLFAYPHDILNLFNNMIFSEDELLRSFSPCYRSLLPQKGYLKPLFRKLFELMYPRYGITDMKMNLMNFDQYWDHSPIVKLESYPPHVDFLEQKAEDYRSYALVIFMNKDNIHGGTQFVKKRYNGRWIETITQQKEQAELELSDEVLMPDTRKPWDYDEVNLKRYHLEPMKFNKLICYRSNVLHSIYTDGSFYQDKSRKTITSTF